VPKRRIHVDVAPGGVVSTLEAAGDGVGAN